ncbi:MAG TPA: FtsX-like permease family protein, partial [Acidobacteriota bacterium]|nr:FtsX-like permease family protein [Acidobacteriota bacterium]
HGLGRARLSLDLIVRSEGNPSSLAAPIREIVRRLAPLQPITRIRTMREVLRGQLAEREFYLAVGSGLSGLALALVLVGIVGILNVYVAANRREFGIRMALGANARQITKGVVRKTLTDGAAGCLAGIFMAIALTQVLEGQLYEISAYDPASFALATLFVMGCLLLASLAPAFRAGEVDPAALLRLE